MRPRGSKTIVTDAVTVERRSHAPRRVRRQLLFLLLAVVVALSVAQAAYAWSWTGYVGIGYANGQCQWYRGQSACSPSSSWTYNDAINAIGGRVLAGFENGNAIRGVYLWGNESARVYRSSLSLNNPTQGHVTFCTWSTACYSQHSAAGIQMTVV
jgi:hypothetical protein